ncbi:MAG: anti-sigma F factor [Ruminococcaceae bacterium]|nr:anti-sigma F factor [Oscillospiraceae bacterium]
MKSVNELRMVFDSKSVNEGFARVAVSSFLACIDPNIEELTDIKTAVSEAVTNSVVHGYCEREGKIYITVSILEKNKVKIRIRDKGVGIENVEKAMEPLFTTVGGERSGLGFAVMESFMDKVRVSSEPGKGTTVTMEKKIFGKRL